MDKISKSINEHAVKSANKVETKLFMIKEYVCLLDRREYFSSHELDSLC